MASIHETSHMGISYQTSVSLTRMTNLTISVFEKSALDLHLCLGIFELSALGKYMSNTYVSQNDKHKVGASVSDGHNI